MRFALAAMLCLPMLLVACGGGGDKPEDPLPTPPGPPLSDGDYVQALCDGIKTWVDATISKSTADELRTALDKFVTDMAALSPPVDARPFHSDFLQYLEDARPEPTLLITKSPPLLGQPLRERLAAAERTATCVAPLFTRADPTPTPGR